VRQARQGKVGVEVGVAVAREVFATAQDAALAQPPREGAGLRDHGARIGPERAIADHRVLRVGIDVENWSEVDRKAERAQLAPQQFAATPREGRVSQRAKRPHRRQFEHRGTQPGDPPPLLIDRDQEGQAGRALGCEACDQRAHLVHVGQISSK
jgi:hypothetical protein